MTKNLAAAAPCGRATSSTLTLYGAVIAAALLPALAKAQPAPSVQAPIHLSAAELQSWRAALAKSPLPGIGCFTTRYPSAAWQAVACAKSPNVPYRPKRGVRPSIVGNGNDSVASTTKLITAATGSFDAVSGVLNEADNGNANVYSLQLNSNVFTNPPACASAKIPAACQGWEQFVYDSAGVGVIQYWLLDYATTCPSGWNTDGTDCWKNAPNTAPYPAEPITNLSGEVLVASANAKGIDTIQISGPGGIAGAAATGSTLSLGNYWHQAEFNVFGNANGTQAHFNSGVSLTVRTTVQSGTTAKPACVNNGTTGETNNLNLTGTCTTVGGTSPAIVFKETNPPGSIWTFTGKPCGTTCTGWEEHDNNDESVRIAATGTNLYQLWNSGQIFESTGQACSGGSCPGWKLISDYPFTYEITAGGGNLYELDTFGNIAQYNSSKGEWQELDANSATVTMAAATGGLYAIHSTGNIWKYTGTPCGANSCTGWQQLDNNSKTVAIAAAGENLYELHNDGTVYQYDGTPCSNGSCPGWKMINNNSRALSIVAGGNNFYELDSNGAIWQYDGTPCDEGVCTGWKQLDNNPAAMMIAADGTDLYELQNTGALWHYDGTPCSGGSCPSWTQIDNDPWTGRIAVSNGSLYQLHIIQTPQERALICYDCR